MTNDRTPQQFVAQWLWSSPKRTSIGEEWSARHTFDVCEMLSDYLEYTRKAHEPSAPHGGKTIECSRCNRPVLLPYVDAYKERVYITPLEGWVTDSAGNFCPQCNGQRTKP